MTQRAETEAALALINAVERTLDDEWKKSLIWNPPMFAHMNPYPRDCNGWLWGARAAVVALGRMRCAAAVPVISRAISQSIDSNMPGLCADALSLILGKPPERVPDWMQP